MKYLLCTITINHQNLSSHMPLHIFRTIQFSNINSEPKNLSNKGISNCIFCRSFCFVLLVLTLSIVVLFKYLFCILNFSERWFLLNVLTLNYLAEEDSSILVAFILSTNSSMMSRNRGHDFSGIVMAVRKFVFTYKNIS